jgi:hypothetical protein
MLKDGMRFFVRNRNPILVIAVLMMASVLVVRQYAFNAEAHHEMREDFIVMEAKGHQKLAEHTYQLLGQSLADLPDQVLVQDYVRTGALLDTNAIRTETLLYKYYCAVGNSLRARAEKRVQAAMSGRKAN